MRSITVQVRQRGMLTLPARLRTKYQLDEGDSLTILDLGESLLLSPKTPVVPQLAAKIERLRKSAGLTVHDLLRPVSVQRLKRTAPKKPEAHDNVPHATSSRVLR